MFAQKKWPKVKYTLFLEITEEEAERLCAEFPVLLTAMRRQFAEGIDRTPTFRLLTDVIFQESRLPYGC